MVITSRHGIQVSASDFWLSVRSSLWLWVSTAAAQTSRFKGGDLHHAIPPTAMAQELKHQQDQKPPSLNGSNDHAWDTNRPSKLSAQHSPTRPQEPRWSFGAWLLAFPGA